MWIDVHCSALAQHVPYADLHQFHRRSPSASAADAAASSAGRICHGTGHMSSGYQRRPQRRPTLGTRQRRTEYGQDRGHSADTAERLIRHASRLHLVPERHGGTGSTSRGSPPPTGSGLPDGSLAAPPARHWASTQPVGQARRTWSDLLRGFGGSSGLRRRWMRKMTSSSQVSERARSGVTAVGRRVSYPADTIDGYDDDGPAGRADSRASVGVA